MRRAAEGGALLAGGEREEAGPAQLSLEPVERARDVVALVVGDQLPEHRVTPEDLHHPVHALRGS